MKTYAKADVFLFAFYISVDGNANTACVCVFKYVKDLKFSGFCNISEFTNSKHVLLKAVLSDHSQLFFILVALRKAPLVTDQLERPALVATTVSNSRGGR